MLTIILTDFSRKLVSHKSWILWLLLVARSNQWVSHFLALNVTSTFFWSIYLLSASRMKIESILLSTVLSLMRRSCHNGSVEICVEPRNCRRTWNILVVVFLNCSCEINFRAPSRYRKGCVIRIKIFHSNSFFFWHSKKKQKSK